MPTCYSTTVVSGQVASKQEFVFVFEHSMNANPDMGRSRIEEERYSVLVDDHCQLRVSILSWIGGLTASITHTSNDIIQPYPSRNKANNKTNGWKDKE